MNSIINDRLYQLWIWVGSRSNRFLHRYIDERDVALVAAKRALEEAFTPEIEAMLNENSNVK